MMTTYLKRSRDVTTEQCFTAGIEHAHHPTRRRLNADVPSILIIGSKDHGTNTSGNIHSSSSSSPSPDNRQFNVLSPATEGSSPFPDPLPGSTSFTNPTLLNPFHGFRNDSSSPHLSPTGMQMLSIDSDIEMDDESQAEDDFDLGELDCNIIQPNSGIPGNELQSHIGTGNIPISTPDESDRSVCFGMIFAAMQLSPATVELSSQDQLINTGEGFDIFRRKKGYYVFLSPLDLKEIGVIDLQTERCLQLLSKYSVRLKGHILPVHVDTTITRKGNLGNKKSRETTMACQNPTLKRQITVTIYGSYQIMASVGKILSSNRKYLQEPDHIDNEHCYQNPHEYKRLKPNYNTTRVESSLVLSSSTVIQAQASAPDPENSNLVSDILDSITPLAALVEDDAADCISTQLLSHQKEGLCFTRRQESGEVLDNDGLWERCQKGSQYVYSHRIINTDQMGMPSTIRGGILADEMGLGKTLTMLATIVRSLSEARSSRQHPTESLQPQLPATLIILPLPLMAEWENEISKHIIPGSVRYHKFHGQGKLELQKLIDFDIILTTYNTLTVESTRGESPLFNAKWFRVVLDEAHLIRNSGTKMFRAVMGLSAHRRWCLTGTPTQNRLSDLLSLLMFLKIPHFETKASLKRYIVCPLKVNDRMGAENLRKLLAACCLRRKNSTLPQSIGVSEIRRLLDMSSAESNRYEKINDDCKRVIDIQVCTGHHSKVYLSILRNINYLRLFCNHGIYLRTSSPRIPMRSNHDWDTTHMDVDASEQDEVETDDPVDLLESFETMRNDTCTHCDIKIVSLKSAGPGYQASGYLTRCSRLICATCLPEKLIWTGKDGREQYCYLCSNTFGTSHLYHFDNTATDLRPMASGGGSGSDSSIPTKINALLDDIQDNPRKEKSIVFSGWTKTLDLVESHLKDLGIDLRRIDGKVNPLLREAILHDFRTNPDASVLLLTTGCGAVGLNLTAASRIHIIEPQWNPMVEKQAMGRVIRLGQTQQVSIYRYIMKDTIEESMLSRQFQKTQLAELIASAGDQSTEDMVGRMKDLRQLI